MKQFQTFCAEGHPKKGCLVLLNACCLSLSLHVLHLHHWQEARRCKKGKKKLRRDTVAVFVCVYLHLLIILSKSHARPSQASYESNHLHFQRLLFKFCTNFAEALMKRDVCV